MIGVHKEQEIEQACRGTIHLRDMTYKTIQALAQVASKRFTGQGL